MKVEKIILAEEICTVNQGVLSEILKYFKDSDSMPDVEYVPHVELKKLTKDCKAVIRTGETSPYANIILQSGCIF